MSSARRRRWIAGAALLIPVLAWSVPFVPRSRCLYGIDFNSYFRPHLMMARDCWLLDGEVPAWNPHQYAGTPYLGNLQCQIYYPPNWIFLALPPEESYEFLVAIHLLLAGWGTYRLARGFRIGRAGAVIAGLAFSLSFSLGARVLAGHLTNFVAQALAPMFVHLVFRAWRKPGATSGALLGGWTGLLILGGTPQWIYHLAALGAAATAWKMWTVKESRIGGMATILIAGLLGALLSAASWLPSLEVASESMRGETRAFYSAFGVGAQQGLVPSDLLHAATPWIPHAEGRLWDRWWHEKGLYIGILPLLLVGAGIRRGPALFFAIAGGLALADAMLPPVHWILSWIPGYGTLRVPARSVWVAVLCMSLLAGFGWDCVRWRRIWPTAILLVGMATVAGIVYRAPRETGIAVALVLAGVWTLRRGDPRLVTILVALDLCFFGLSIQKTVPPESFGAAPWYEPWIGGARTDYRVLDTSNHDAQAVSRGFRFLNGYGHPLPKRTVESYSKAWADYRGARAESLSAGTRIVDPDILAMLNVRWIVGKSLVPPPRWREIARQGEEVLYEDPEARSLARTSSAPCSARRLSINRIEVLHGQGTVVVSEAWMPGWRAELEGRVVPVLPAEGGLLSVESSGGGRLVLTYDPPAARTGRFLSLLGLGALAILAMIRRKRT